MVSLVSSIETSHDDMIHAAELDYYGMYLATCSSDNTIKIFDIKNEANLLVADLKGHQSPVWEVSWAHPKFGNVLASCSYDRKVIIWKKNGLNWQKLYECNNESSVNSVCWAPPEFGMNLACASSDGSVTFLNLNSENNSWECEKIPNAHAIGCNTISWCPGSCFEASTNAFSERGTDKRLASGGCDNSVKIWIERSGRWIEETRLEAHSDWVRSVAWAPVNGESKMQIASASQDRHVIIWTTINMMSWSSIILNIFDDVLWSVCWSLSGKILAVTNADNKITLWKENNEHQWLSINDNLHSM